MKRKIFLLNFFTLIFIALNLRAPITSIAPLAQDVQHYFLLNSALVGFLTSLPLIAFGIFSFLVFKLHHIRAMIGALICIICGELVRAYGEYIFLFLNNFLDSKNIRIFSLFLGTIIMGGGIAVANVLLPTFVKAKFPKNISQMMGIYSLTLNTSAILGLLLALFLMRSFGLLNAMAFWSIFGFLALILYLPQAKNSRYRRAKVMNLDSKINVFSNINSWKITIFMGLQSFMFYGIIVWLPKIIESKGYSIDRATFFTLISQFVALFSSFIIPALIARIRNKYKAFFMFLICFLYILGMLLLYLFDDKTGLIISTFILGVPMGAVFTIALLFITQKSSSILVSIKLSSLSQGVGYLIASVSPFLVGRFYDIFGRFSEAILAFCIVGAMLCFVGFLANKAEVI